MINSSPKPFQYFITQVNLLEMSQKDDLECEEVKKTKQKEKIYKYLEKQNLYIEEFPLIKTIEKMFSSSKTTDSILRTQIKCQKWTRQDKILLSWVVFQYLRIYNKKQNEINKENWKIISDILNRNYLECAFKFNSLLLSQTQNEEWSIEEDKLLKEIVKNQQNKEKKIRWKNVAREFYEKSTFYNFRNEKMCRSRWISQLDPSLNKSPWTIDEDIILLYQYSIFKSQWSEISLNLKGRNVYAIKNRFVALCKNFKIQKNQIDFEFILNKIIKEFIVLRNLKDHNQQKKLEQATNYQKNCNQTENFLQPNMLNINQTQKTQIIVKSINFHDSTQINFLTHPTHIIYGLSHDDYLNWSLKNLRESSFNLSDNSDKGFSEKCLEFDVDKYFSF